MTKDKTLELVAKIFDDADTHGFTVEVLVWVYADAKKRIPLASGTIDEIAEEDMQEWADNIERANK